MALITYYDFAEDDYKFFMAAFRENIIGNSLAGMAQNACEKYLKHIVSEYDESCNKKENLEKKERILKTHSLQRIMKYVECDMETEIPKKIYDSLMKIDGYYFSTRYPGDNSIEVDKRDIDNCREALVNCKSYVDDFIKSQTKKLRVCKD